MLKLKDFKNFQVHNSKKLKGGAATGGGTHQVFMSTFNYGRDVTDGAGTTAFCDITNSAFGPDTCGGPSCC